MGREGRGRNVSTASNSAARARDEGLSLVEPGSRSSRSTSLSNSEEDASKVQERRNARGEARAHRPSSRFNRRWDLGLDALSRRRKPRREGEFQPIARLFRPVFHGAPSPSRRAIEPAARANLSDQKGSRGGRWKVNRGGESPCTWAARGTSILVGCRQRSIPCKFIDSLGSRPKKTGFAFQEKDPK